MLDSRHGNTIKAATLAWLLLYGQCLPAQQVSELANVIFEAALPDTNPASDRVRRNTPFSPSSSYFSNVSSMSAQEALATIVAYRDNIENRIKDEGPFSASLVQDYFALGQHYQAVGQHIEAIETLEQAQYINRINNGLITEDLFNLVRAEIASHLALGDLRRANREQQYLYYLGREHFGSSSMEIVPVLNSLGDWHMDNFNVGIVRKPAFAISIGRITTPDPRFMAFSNLFRAEMFYSQAIQTLLVNRNIYDPALIELERKLTEAIFYSSNRSGFLADPSFYTNQSYRLTGSSVSRVRFSRSRSYFEKGRNSYERLRTYLFYQPDATIQDLVQVMLQEGDWYLLHDYHAGALSRYDDLLELMRRNGIAEAEIKSLFSPEIPVQLPVFTALPHSREYLGIDPETKLDYTGYIDVSFQLSRYGSVKKLKVLQTSGTITEPIEKRLKQLLRNTPFRPNVLDENAHRETINLRYYVADASRYR